MAIKDLLVHLDETPASTARLQAALALAAACGAQVTALYLIAEPFLPGMGGRHLPAELLREHLAHAEAEAEAVLRCGAGRGRAAGSDPGGGARQRPAGPAAAAAGAARPLHGSYRRRPGRSRGARDRRHGAGRGGVHGQRPPGAGDPARRCRRAAAAARAVAWDGSREAARAASDAMPLLQLAEQVLVLVVDARATRR